MVNNLLIKALFLVAVTFGGALDSCATGREFHFKVLRLDGHPLVVFSAGRLKGHPFWCPETPNAEKRGESKMNKISKKKKKRWKN